MSKIQFFGILRSVLISVSAVYLGSRGYDASQIEAICTTAVIVLSTAWSYLEKYYLNKKASK